VVRGRLALDVEYRFIEGTETQRKKISVVSRIWLKRKIAVSSR